MNLLREYFKLILISEGKVEDLAKQNPNIPVTDLASSDTTPTKKLLPWMIKQVSKGADVEHVRSVASRFAKDGSRLKNKDINSYSEIDELESALDALGASKRSETIQAKSGAVKIYEDDTCVVLRIDTKEAAQQYGKGTKWCITSLEGIDYFEHKVYTNSLFYFILKKEQLNDDYDKLAVDVSRDYENNIIEYTIYDASDNEIDNDELISEDVYDAIEIDVFDQPFNFKEFIEDWQNTKKQLRIISLIDRNLPKIRLEELYRIETDEEVLEILSDLIDGIAKIDQGRDAIIWFKNGKIHRENNKPAMIYGDGTKYWLKNGLEYEPNNL